MKRRGFAVVVQAIIALIVLFLTACGSGSSGSTQPPPPTQVTILTAAPTQASEGSVYSYTMQASVSAATFELTSGPSGSTLTGGTLNWTPTSVQARTENKFTVTARSGGSSAVQNWSVTPQGHVHFGLRADGKSWYRRRYNGKGACSGHGWWIRYSQRDGCSGWHVQYSERTIRFILVDRGKHELMDEPQFNRSWSKILGRLRVGNAFQRGNLATGLR
jgi:hypothetical protein